MGQLSPADIACAWWRAVDEADFARAILLMEPTATVDWPLSNERMDNPDSWKLVNENYPGRWKASIRSLIADGERVVTIVNVTDGGIAVVAISYFTIENGVIVNLVEYWPESYAAPGWRSKWVTAISR